MRSRWLFLGAAVVGWGCGTTRTLPHPIGVNEVKEIRATAAGAPLELDYIRAPEPATGASEMYLPPGAIERQYGRTMAMLSGVESDGTLDFVSSSGAPVRVPQASLSGIEIPHHGRGALRGLGYGALGGAVGGVVFGAVLGAVCSGNDAICFSPGVLAVAAGIEFAVVGAVVGVITGAAVGSPDRFEITR